MSETTAGTRSIFVLMVCTGNTCRSPMAEALLRHHAHKAERGEIITASAGVMAGDGGMAAEHAVEVLAKRGIDLKPHRSRALRAEAVRQADLILVMERQHADFIAEHFEHCQAKTFMATDFGPRAGRGIDVPDPVGGDLDNYAETATLLESCITGLLEHVDRLITERDKTIAIGTDHRGVGLKNELAGALEQRGFRVLDSGAHGDERCDFPVFAFDVAERVGYREVGWGVLVCASGIGMAIAANKVPGVRAAVVHSLEQAKMSREHNDANVLVLAAGSQDAAGAAELVQAWINTPHLGDRYQMRNEIIALYEMGYTAKEAEELAMQRWQRRQAAQDASPSREPERTE